MSYEEQLYNSNNAYQVFHTQYSLHDIVKTIEAGSFEAGVKYSRTRCIVPR